MSNFDSEIKKVLTEKTKDVMPSDNLLIRIKSRLYEEREIKNMKKFKFTPKIAIAAVFTIVLATAAIGAGKIKYTTSHSSLLDEIKHFPDKAEVEEIVGFSPKYVENLGGFEFKAAHPGSGSANDEQGNTINEFKDISFWYTTESGMLTLSMHPVLSEESQSNYDDEIDYEGIPLYYDSFIYKSVPPEYERTAEEAILEEQGELQIGYGASEIDEDITQAVTWYEDGISYCLLAMDVEVSKEEVINMAKQVIDEK